MQFTKSISRENVSKNVLAHCESRELEQLKLASREQATQVECIYKAKLRAKFKNSPLLVHQKMKMALDLVKVAIPLRMQDNRSASITA